MAGRVIGGTQRDRLHFFRPVQLGNEAVEVHGAFAHPCDGGLSQRQLGGDARQVVEHRAATCCGANQVFRSVGCAENLGQRLPTLGRGICSTLVVGQCATATLRCRGVNLTTQRLKNCSCCAIHLRGKHLACATEEQANPWPSLRGCCWAQQLRELLEPGRWRWKLLGHAPQGRRQSVLQFEGLGEFAEAKFLAQARWSQPAPQAIAVGKDLALDFSREATLRSRSILRASSALADSERLQDSAIFDATRTGRFTGTAVQAMIQMSCDRCVELEAIFVDCAHQEQAPARALVLVARFQIGRADLLAKAAVHAVQCTWNQRVAHCGSLTVAVD